VKGRTVHETQAGDADPRAEAEALDRLAAWHSRRPRLHRCRACAVLHRREAVVCGEAKCEAWLARYEAELVAVVVIADERLT